MANLSSYRSDVLLEVPHSKIYHNDMDNQSVHAMQDFKQTPVVDFSHTEIHSDSNIIPYSQYLQETQLGAVQETSLYAQQDSIILSVIEQMSEQMINHILLNVVPQQKLSDEQAFWLQTSHPNTDQSALSPVKFEAPRELPKFWNTVVVKQSNDVTRLQALVDKKKVVITEATIRDALCLDDAERVDCLPSEEIFAELARMGYEKPTTKLTSAMASAVICLSTGQKFNFSKYIFESLVRNVDSSSKFYMYPRFIQLIIQNQLGDLSTHTTTYTSPALTQKVFANMRRVGKGFSRVETPLFEGMLVAGEIQKQGDAEEHVQDDVDDAATQGADTAVEGDVVHETSIPSLTPRTPPPQQSQDLPSTSQEALNACTTLARRVEHLEYDKVAQALEITKLKRRLKQLERGNKVKVLKLRMLKKVGTSQRIKSSDDNEMEDASNQGRMTYVLMVDKEDKKKTEKAMGVGDDQEDKPEVQKVVNVVTTTKLIIEVVSAASESVPAASTTTAAAEPQVPAATITAAPIRVVVASTRRRKGVVIRDPEEESTVIIPNDTKSKDKGKGIMIEEPKPMKKKQQVEMDEEYARKLHEELNKDINWDVAIDHVKQKAKEDPLDYFKGMYYDDIRLIFEAKFNLNIEFLLKSKEQIEEEENRAIQSINEPPAQKAAKRRKLKISNSIWRLEDLESLWSLVKERFSTSKPNNFSGDYLLTALGALFERPDGQAQVWKNQRTVHGQARVKS
nr:hypothetical protein [Tanacetum cinerariifolium]